MTSPNPAPQQQHASQPERRDRYPYFLPITTRWMDNDIYGHVNNVVYYSYFDTVINRYLIEKGGLDIHRGDVIGLAVETHCRFVRPIIYPQGVDAGLRVAHLGRSSTRYEIGLFAPGAALARTQVGPSPVENPLGTVRPKYVRRLTRKCQDNDNQHSALARLRPRCGPVTAT